MRKSVCGSRIEMGPEHRPNRNCTSPLFSQPLPLLPSWARPRVWCILPWGHIHLLPATSWLSSTRDVMTGVFPYEQSATAPTLTAGCVGLSSNPSTSLTSSHRVLHVSGVCVGV